ncbi:MAG: 4Fe-4S dicluster domain-containing protein [Candidatus Bathyarchaeota archaeon]|nr:4Fe-4S dicluster domain-containing protein [Candidatus Bathyarchaeota archaeon]
MRVALINSKLCSGCRACEVACSFWHYKTFNPKRSRIRVVRLERAIDVPVVCRQCGIPQCAKNCFVHAIRRDGEMVTLDQNRCFGCEKCVEDCPFGAVTIDPKSGKAVKCDLCGGNPKCVEACVSGALKLVNGETLAKMKRKNSARLFIRD